MIRKIKKQRVLDWIFDERYFTDSSNVVFHIKNHFGQYPIVGRISLLRDDNLIYVLGIEQWGSFKYNYYRHLTTLEKRNGLTLRKKSYRPY